MNQKSLDMTQGDPLRLLIWFSVPTLIGNVLNQVYSITDSIIVGRYLGQTAFAAVGSTMPIVLLLAALMIGVNIGVSILLSQSFGRQDIQMMRRTFSNSLYFGSMVSIFIAIAGPICSEQVLRWMGTPDAVMGDATVYLQVNFMTSICPMIYYLFSCVFRGMGDSKTVLYCLILSVIANIALVCSNSRFGRSRFSLGNCTGAVGLLGICGNYAVGEISSNAYEQKRLNS